tara:strand:+ start:1757 stop:2392 length:636 start_codon:yes stop_codon:yes gene_type:complete
MSIDNIKATIAKKGGLAPSNRFNVIFTPPSQALLNLNKESIVGSLLSGNFSAGNLINDPRDISILCQSVEMPGRNISTFDHGDVNQVNKFPYTFIDDDITFTFLLTNDYYMRQMFDNWMSGIFDTDSYRVGYKKDYSVDVVIQQLNQKEIPVYGVRLEKAFPITMNSIELNQDAQNVLQMSVTFAYNKFVPEGPLSSTASAIRSAIPGGLI